ncbi:MAG: gamma-glutamyl-gamma-aminobutyrate hydrolase family protein [Vulcanimicrobiaceae bacterium]
MESAIVRPTIGISFHQGTAPYDRYLAAVNAAARRLGLDVEALWFARGTRGQPAVRVASREAEAESAGFVLTGGADVEPSRYGFDDPARQCNAYPGRDAIESTLLASALERGVPILAICRGLQLLNVQLGGRLIPHLPTAAIHAPSQGEGRHSVEIEPETLLSATLRAARAAANSSHHQAVDQAALGTGLRIAARADDGTIEALEWKTPATRPWLLAVQWHPERLSADDPLGGRLFDAFLSAVREATAARTRDHRAQDDDRFGALRSSSA